MLENSSNNTEKNINNLIFFLGANHLSNSCSVKVKHLIQTISFDCIMLELDKIRYQQLVLENRTYNQLDDEADLKFDSSFLNVFSKFQEDLGGLLGIFPGNEMMEALHIAKKKKIKIELIDRPIDKTFRKLEQNRIYNAEEQINLSKSLNIEKIDISETQSIIESFSDSNFLREIITDFKKEYPTMYQILFTERNEYMSNKIIQYHVQQPKQRLLVIVGLAHMNEIYEIVKNSIEL